MYRQLTNIGTKCTIYSTQHCIKCPVYAGPLTVAGPLHWRVFGIRGTMTFFQTDSYKLHAHG